jgi:NADH-quinone oxidoreductase subunit A
MQFRVGYYLFAILYLVFDVETVLLFPWAVVAKSLGAQGLFCVLFFLFILVLGLAYAWKKGVLAWK